MAFALTIKKAEGQAIKKAGLFAEEPIFHHNYTQLCKK